MTDRVSKLVEQIKAKTQGTVALIANKSEVHPEAIQALRDFARALGELPPGVVDLGELKLPPSKADSAIVAKRLQIGEYTVGLVLWVEA